MENTYVVNNSKGLLARQVLLSFKMRPFSLQFAARNAAAIGLMACLCTSSSSFGQEWSEKDLTKSVHRAERTFEAGEMSRAYGLFAHLVSVAGDRPFLHYRFGAICTYTGTRLAEAEEHLEWANELGILETEHAGGWYFYSGKLRQLQYRFEEAKSLFDAALDASSGDEDWLNEAKLRFGQCDRGRNLAGEVKAIDLISSLESHSSDFFRLYQLPQESGRLLVTPESLLGKEDAKRGYTSIMHWLPGQRFAFFSSYGKNGDTGLDIYRVSVSSSGAYGTPEKLPEPVNSDFDDSHPICIPTKDAYTDPDLLYFSSSRPESMGGMDIFQVYGLFTGESLGMVAKETLEQLPFEVNSTRDEWLFWLDESTNKGWVSTNRSKDFEGKEIWQFNWNKETVDPVSIRIELAIGTNEGVLQILDDSGVKTILEHGFENGNAWDLVVAGGSKLQLIWQDVHGVSHPLQLSIPALVGGHVAMESALLQVSSESAVTWETVPTNFIPQDELVWTDAALSKRHHHGTWVLESSDEVSSAFRANAESAKWQFSGAKRSSALPTESTADAFPAWFVNGMKGLENSTWDDDMGGLESSESVRSKALMLQNRLEALSCWEAPDNNEWKSHQAIERIGEPVLASMAQEAIELNAHVENQTALWKTCKKEVDRNLRLNPEKEAEYIALKMFLDNQFQAFKGTEIQSEDLIRRIEVHLQFERWLSDALPIAMKDFQSFLVHLTINDLGVSNSIRDVARVIASNQPSEAVLTALQSNVWESLVESIIDLQSLGVYDLPDMQPAQQWFLRSGSLMDEVLDASGTQYGRLSKGRRSVSLAWDAMEEGKKKRDVVYADVELSSGEWWEKFGPTTNPEQTAQFQGYDLFVKGNAMLIEQAELYQVELDHIRLVSAQSKSGREAVKKAISMRSSMANELQSMFGQLETEGIARNVNVKTTTAVKRSISPTDVESSPKELETEGSIPEPESLLTSELIPTAGETSSYYTLQVGVFQNDPDWTIDANMLLSETAASGRTRYFYGHYATKAEATQALQTILDVVPDAFILSRGHSARMTSIQEVVNNPTKAPPTSPAENNDHTTTQSFRVKVASFGANLRPHEVAQMLRLGNEFNLKTVRLSNSTTYFSDTFHSEMEAIRVLGICLSNGFVDAVVEPID
jgi:hypothetical protein